MHRLPKTLRVPASLALTLLGTACATTKPAPAAPEVIPDSPAHVAALAPDEAWSHLPRATPKLPQWARTLVASLPRTTAMQMDLDHLHRTKNPLGPVLAAQIRWTVADALGSPASKAAAEADLVRAGTKPEEIARLVAADPALPDAACLSFVRKTTLAASELTDAEVAAIIGAYGPDDAVAIVHTAAFANFQDRILLGLGIREEPGGPAAPLEVRATAEAPLTAPPRTPPDAARAAATVVAGDGAAVRATWKERTFEEIRAALDAQRARKPRIADPDSVRLARLPRPVRPRLGRIAWGTVSVGYQPNLVIPWSQMRGAFEQESKIDEAFASTVFWVVTRTNDCFY